MGVRVGSWLSRPGLIRALAAHVRLAVRLIREPGVPWLLKLIPLLAVAYLVFPLDVVPDVLPVFGELDDLAVAVAALELFIGWCPEGAVAFHRAAIAAGRRYSPMPAGRTVIDAEWRRA